MMKDDSVFTGPTGFVLPKNCAFAEDVDAVIGHLVHSGIMYKIFHKDVSARYERFRCV